MMTNEQTIELLSEIRCGYNCFIEEERPFYKALSVAIEALSNTPNTLEALECVELDNNSTKLDNKNDESIKNELEKMMDDLEITADNRHLNDYEYGWNQALYHLWDKIDDWLYEDDCQEPSVQPEPSIPLSWFDEQIERLKSLDNAFATLTAMQISGMVKKWSDEQDG